MDFNSHMLTTLREKLAEIARIEDEHNFLGVRFTLRAYVDECHSRHMDVMNQYPNSNPFTPMLTADALADHVLATYRSAIELSKKDIPWAHDVYPDSTQA
jgi:hypothetical protein